MKNVLSLETENVRLGAVVKIYACMDTHSRVCRTCSVELGSVTDFSSIFERSIQCYYTHCHSRFGSSGNGTSTSIDSWEKLQRATVKIDASLPTCSPTHKIHAVGARESVSQWVY